MDMPMAELTERIIRCIIKVHKTLGPGFLESIYRRALEIEFQNSGLAFDSERDVVVFYDGQEVGRHRLDLIVDGSIAVELKAIDALSQAHYAQLRSYLKATGLRVGLLVNFAKPMADFRRIEL
jgi:GxxExxY protein